LSQLASLFTQYGVDAFLESTSLLVVLLDQEGTPLTWNPAFNSFTVSHSGKTRFKEVLSASSQERFTELLATSVKQRIRTKGELEFAREARSDSFICLFIPLPGGHVLLIGEPTTSLSQLASVMAELQKTKRILTIKETELQAVIAQADEVSHTDALTFLPNRRQIVKDLQNEVSFSDHYGTPLSVSMLDIDHFKKINDTYGHPVGDEVLRNLAGELREHIRYPDTIARYGGEEFLIVLPHSTLKAASEQAERLCRHVRSLRVKSGEQEIAITVSIGLAQYNVHKEDWEALLSRADAALYQAKNSGRDRWAAAED
jgi:diguanylate cyclase (GGDEF)-like protein